MSEPRTPQQSREYQERLEHFATLVFRHDLTWDYADDSRARQRGQTELGEIRKAARGLEHSDVRRVWNAQVDRKIVEAGRSAYYWTDPRQWGGREPALSRQFATRAQTQIDAAFRSQTARREDGWQERDRDERGR